MYYNYLILSSLLYSYGNIFYANIIYILTIKFFFFFKKKKILDYIVIKIKFCELKPKNLNADGKIKALNNKLSEASSTNIECNFFSATITAPLEAVISKPSSN